MKDQKYDVQLLLPDGQTYWTICTCHELDQLVQLLLALLRPKPGAPGEVKIVTRCFDL